VTESLLTGLLGPLGAAAAPWAVAAAGGVIAVATVVGLGRQRAALERLDERIGRLTAAVTLLTNTAEDGLRGVASELGRVGPAAAKASAPAPAPTTQRQRVAAAAGHGRTVQDIAACEQLSEGEVLLHLLLEKLQSGGARADVC
jgi:hypothetical protein